MGACGCAGYWPTIPTTQHPDSRRCTEDHEVEIGVLFQHPGFVQVRSPSLAHNLGGLSDGVHSTNC